MMRVTSRDFRQVSIHDGIAWIAVLCTTLPSAAFAFDPDYLSAAERALAFAIFVFILAVLILVYRYFWKWLAPEENKIPRKLTKLYLVLSVPMIFVYGIGLLMLLLWPVIPVGWIAIKQAFSWIKE